MEAWGRIITMVRDLLRDTVRDTVGMMCIMAGGEIRTAMCPYCAHSGAGRFRVTEEV